MKLITNRHCEERSASWRTELCKSGSTSYFVTYLRRDCFVPRNDVMVKFIFTIIFCLLLSVIAWGQNSDAIRKDTSKITVKLDAPRSPKSKPLIILDDAVYKADLKTIDPLSIMNVSIMKTNDAIAKYGKTGNNGAIIITTKNFSISSYKAKLSSFSKKYQTYLASHQNDDKDFEYVVDGTSFDKLDYNTIIKLYKIPVEKIKMVDMVENPQHNGYDGKKEIVNIITKQ